MNKNLTIASVQMFVHKEKKEKLRRNQKPS